MKMLLIAIYCGYDIWFVDGGRKRLRVCSDNIIVVGVGKRKEGREGFFIIFFDFLIFF